MGRSFSRDITADAATFAQVVAGYTATLHIDVDGRSRTMYLTVQHCGEQIAHLGSFVLEMEATTAAVETIYQHAAQVADMAAEVAAGPAMVDGAPAPVDAQAERYSSTGTVYARIDFVARGDAWQMIETGGVIGASGTEITGNARDQRRINQLIRDRRADWADVAIAAGWRSDWVGGALVWIAPAVDLAASAAQMAQEADDATNAPASTPTAPVAPQAPAMAVATCAAKNCDAPAGPDACADCGAGLCHRHHWSTPRCTACRHAAEEREAPAIRLVTGAHADTVQRLLHCDDDALRMMAARVVVADALQQSITDQLMSAAATFGADLADPVDIPPCCGALFCYAPAPSTCADCAGLPAERLEATL